MISLKLHLIDRKIGLKAGLYLGSIMYINIGLA